MQGKRIVYLAVCVLLASTALGFADVPLQMSFQGQLLDNAGNPLPDGPKGMRIIIWDDSVASSPDHEVWNSGPLAVTTTSGVFTVIVGAPGQPPIDPATMKNSPRYLGVTVGADPEMSPRVRLGAAPYAWTARNADRSIKADTASMASTVDWSGIGNKPAGFADGVDDNTTYSANSPVSLSGTTFGLVAYSIADAHVSPSAAIAPSKIAGTAATLYGSNTFNGNHNYFGDSAMHVYRSAGLQYVEMGRNSVVPLVDRVLNVTRQFSSTATVYGTYTHVSNVGSTGDAVGGEFNAYGASGSTSRTVGAKGDASSCTGYGEGIQGLALSNLNAGVGTRGTARLNANSNRGVEGFAEGPNPCGVYASASGTTATSWATYGVYGLADGRGFTSQAFGIYGYALNATTNNYAGWFEGRTHVNGTLSKSAGSFMIDHPLDPENKYLQHSFVESPDMKNIYDGVVTTDANGDAVVTMSPWFDALNQEFRYQLTVIGEFAQAIISTKMSGNSFSIKTDKPNIEVSWQVTGIRHDAYANANRIQVEVDKHADKRGKYMHPEAFGLDKSRGEHWDEIQRSEKQAAEQAKANSEMTETQNVSN